MNINDLPEPASRKLIELAEAKDAAEFEARATAERLAGLGGPDVDFRMVEKLQQRRAAASNRQAELSGLVNNLKNWVNKARGTFERVPPEPVELADGESIIRAVERTRDQISSLQHRLDATRNAPPPKSDLKKLAAQDVQDLAARGRPRFDVRDGRPVFDHVDGQTQDMHTALTDAIAAVAFYCPEQVLAKRIAAIDAVPDRADALAANEKQKRMNELAEQLEVLERGEEALIEASETQGIAIARREDADPRAVLGVQVVRTGARAAVA